MAKVIITAIDIRRETVFEYNKAEPNRTLRYAPVLHFDLYMDNGVTLSGSKLADGKWALGFYDFLDEVATEILEEVQKSVYE